jgi:hypothetical protein
MLHFRGMLSEEVKSSLRDVRDRVLGPIAERDVHSDKGTAFERTRPTKVQDGRCYAYGNSYEVPKVLVAPCADGCSTKNPEILELRKDLLKVRISLLIGESTLICSGQISTEVAMTNLQYAPPEILEHLELNAEITNLPHIGTDDNVAFTSNQLNIVGVECKGQGQGTFPCSFSLSLFAHDAT